jgi:hypothetical protein
MTTREDRLAPGSVARAILIAIGLLGLALMLWAGRNVLFVLFFGVLVGVFLTVFTDRLVRVGVPRVVGVVMVLAAGGSVGGSVLGRAVAHGEGPALHAGPGAAPGGGGGQRLDPLTQYREATGRVGEPSVDLEEQVRGTLGEQPAPSSAARSPSSTRPWAPLPASWWSSSSGSTPPPTRVCTAAGVERMIPPRHRARVAEAMDRTGHSLRRWMIGTLINMVIVGTGPAMGLWLLGIPPPSPWASSPGCWSSSPSWAPSWPQSPPSPWPSPSPP